MIITRDAGRAATSSSTFAAVCVTRILRIHPTGVPTVVPGFRARGSIWPRACDATRGAPGGRA